MMMTGCGSTLWMAPEIVLGELFNEKVDIYSYAMCLVELLDCHLPWHGYGMNVPFLCSRGDRPLKQLHPAWRQQMDNGRASGVGGAGVGGASSSSGVVAAAGRMEVEEEFVRLVRDCWGRPVERPTFTEIVARLEAMLTGPE